MKKLLLALLLPVVAIAAPYDLLLSQRNAANTAYPSILVAPAANSLLGFGSSKAVGNVTVGNGLLLSGGSLSLGNNVSVDTVNAVNGFFNNSHLLSLFVSNETRLYAGSSGLGIFDSTGATRWAQFTSTGLNATPIGETTPANGNFAFLSASNSFSGAYAATNLYNTASTGGVQINLISNLSGVQKIGSISYYPGAFFNLNSPDTTPIDFSVNGGSKGQITATGFQGAVGVTTRNPGNFTTLGLSNNITQSQVAVINNQFSITSAGTANYVRNQYNSDTIGGIMQLDAYSSNYATSAYQVANGVGLAANGTGGLALVASAGKMKLYAGSISSPSLVLQNGEVFSIGAGAAPNGGVLGLGRGGTSGAQYSYIKNTGTTNDQITYAADQHIMSGTFRLFSYGAGTLVTDSSGNVTASSDETLKDIQGYFTRGLSSLRGVKPISYKWKASTGLDRTETYSGFSAQNVLTAIPEAIGIMPSGTLTLQDRAILATTVNAINELDGIVRKQQAQIAALVDALKAVNAKVPAVVNVAPVAGALVADDSTAALSGLRARLTARAVAEQQAKDAAEPKIKLIARPARP